MDISQKPTLLDNFFQIGGTSINAVHAVAKINEHFAVTIEKFIAARTIGDLVAEADLVSEEKADNLTNLMEMGDIEVCNFQLYCFF